MGPNVTRSTRIATSLRGPSPRASKLEAFFVTLSTALSRVSLKRLQALADGNGHGEQFEI
eukprot:3275992-Ditylum_brightwellii.AAC.1